MRNYFLAFKNIFNYRDGATLSEFWNFFITNIIVSVILLLSFKKLGFPDYVFTIYKTISIMTLVSLGFRRLKNAGLSGWLFLIPIVNLFLASLPEKKV